MKICCMDCILAPYKEFDIEVFVAILVVVVVVVVETTTQLVACNL